MLEDSLVDGNRIMKRFVVGKNVYLVKRESSNELFVLKVLEGVINNEIKIGMELGPRCPYLIRIYEVISKVDCNSIHILMEYCDGGDVQDLIDENYVPNDEEIYRFTYEGASALEVLHSNNVIHRDVKPRNFFRTKNAGIKLGDYGVARIMDSTPLKTMTVTGTPGYMSPEILNGDKMYGSKTDIYSFGITLLQFITGKHPFSNENGSINMGRVIAGKPIDAILKHPHPCAKLALQMIVLDPDQRPTAAEVRTAALPLLGPYHSLVLETTRLRESEARLEMEIATLKKENATLKSKIPAQLPNNAKLSAVFLVNKERNYTFTTTSLGQNCSFTGDEGTVFLDRSVTEGVFQWTVQISYEGRSNLRVGASPIDNLYFFSKHRLGYQALAKGACSFGFDKRTFGAYRLWLDGVDDDSDMPEVVPDKALITLEVDTEAHALYLFLYGKRVSRGISDVEVPLYLGVSKIFGCPSVTSVSFCRLPNPTPSVEVCKLYSVRKK